MRGPQTSSQIRPPPTTQGPPVPAVRAPRRIPTNAPPPAPPSRRTVIGIVNEVLAGMSPTSEINGMNSQPGCVGITKRLALAAINPWFVIVMSTWVSSPATSERSTTEGSIVTTGTGTAVSNTVSIVILVRSSTWIGSTVHRYRTVCRGRNAVTAVVLAASTKCVPRYDPCPSAVTSTR